MNQATIHVLLGAFMAPVSYIYEVSAWVQSFAFTGTYALGNAREGVGTVSAYEKNKNIVLADFREFHPKFVISQRMKVHNRENQHVCNTLALKVLSIVKSRRMKSTEQNSAAV